MKKKITFGSLEDQEKDFLEYSKGLSVKDRLKYMTELTRKAYAREYESRLKEALSKETKKKIVIISSLPGESLASFFDRVNQYKLNEYF
jgi:hypothetical protein